MRIVKLNAQQFDKISSIHRYRNYYQTSMYANTITKFGYKSQYIGIINDNNKIIGASLIIYKEVFMNYKIAYAPRGILLNYESINQLEELVTNLKKTLGKQGFMILRMDPYIPLTIRDFEGNIMNFNNKGNTIIENLTQVGFNYKGKNLYFENEKPRWEGIVLLQKDIREIFNKVDKKTRNKIRKASNSGLKIVRDPNKDITELYNFIKKKEQKPISYYKELCKNYGNNIDIYYAKLNTETFLINSRRNYEKELEYNDSLAEKIQDMNIDPKDKEICINKKMESDRLIVNYKNSLLKSTELLRKFPDGITVSGALVIKYDNAAYIFVEGMDDKYTNINPNHLVKWQMISDYTKEGLKYLNLNGVVGEFEKANKFSGINENKLGFNTIITEYVGEFDIVLNNFAYNLYKKMNKK